MKHKFLVVFHRENQDIRKARDRLLRRFVLEKKWNKFQLLDRELQLRMNIIKI